MIPLLLLQRSADFFTDTRHVAEIQTAVRITWSAHANQRHVGITNGFRRVGRRRQPVRLHNLFQQWSNSRLDDWTVTGIDHRDLVCINVDADDGVAFFRKARRRNTTDITETEDT